MSETIKYQVIKRGTMRIEFPAEPMETRADAERAMRLLQKLRPAAYEILESVDNKLGIPILLDPEAPEDRITFING